MFKKLKEKVIDSQTSQKFQQITQSVSDKFGLDKDENFFSLTEDDNAINSPNASMTDPGFSNISLHSADAAERQRKNSSSSMMSDTFFLPRYDSVSSLYHLQSDLDISASEIEDNASTSSQVGHLSKEQIYAAFQKSQMRYHKYRGRFTDLANHYKNLEREFTKLKTELERTQERSFRRVKELKEQCELEQKAKAHLESSLRMDLDEKQIQINTLKEKISLLQSSSQSFVDTEQLNKSLADLKHEHETLNTTNQEMKAKLIIIQSKEEEYKEKIRKLCDDMERMKDDEKENNLKLAQSKMEIHNELLSKEAEVKSLQQENDSLKNSLQKYETKTESNGKVEQLLIHNKNLVEKVEQLSTKCQTLDQHLLKLEQYKIENSNLKAKLSELKKNHDEELMNIKKEADGFKEKLFKEKQEKEDIIDDLEKLMLQYKENSEKENQRLKDEIEVIRNEAQKRLLTIEQKITRKLENEYAEKEKRMKMEFEDKLKELNQKEGVDELQLELLSVRDRLKMKEDEYLKTQNSLKEVTEKYKDLENNYLELSNKLGEKNGELGKLVKKLEGLNDMEEKINRLNANIATLQNEKEELNLKLSEMQNNEPNVSELDDKIRLLEKEKNNRMHELDGLKEEFEKLSEHHASDKMKIDEYKLKFEESSRSKEDLERQLEETKRNLQMKENSVKDVSQQMQAQRQYVRNLEENLNILDKSEKDAKAEVASKTKELTELQKSLADVQKLYTTEKKDIMKQLNDLKLVEKSYYNLLDENENLKEQISEIALLQENLKALSNVEVENHNLASQLKDLQNDCLSLKQEYSDCMEKLQNEHKDFANFKQLHVDCVDSQVVRENYEQLKIKHAELESSKKSELEELKLVYEKSLAEQEEKLRNKSEKLLLDLEALRTSNEELNSKILKLDIQKRELESSCAITEKEKKELSSEVSYLRNTIQTIEIEKQEIEALFKESSNAKEKYDKLSVELNEVKTALSKLKEEKEILERDNKTLISDNKHISEESTKLIGELEELKLTIESYRTTKVELEEEEIKLTKDKEELTSKLSEALTEIEVLKNKLIEATKTAELQPNYDDALSENKKLKTEVAELQKKIDDSSEEKRKLQTTVNELEQHQTELLNEKQLLKEEVEELKISPITLPSNYSKKLDDLGMFKNDNGSTANDAEIEQMLLKVTQLKSLDITNKATIEFYENEVEKLRNNNEKLNRKLDETLVTLNHCSELSQSTELVYLKNVLYNYMIGKESVVLARVIATVCKFDDEQTDEVLKREQQKQTLFAKLGFV